ncbi:glutamate--tRNA ligase family protein, partial [Nocardiopsis sp. CNR-923]|uniref:glutamate--tRNA ligase family protein n=1 Tax=Nocardiopsis sp. CNR-923 TaxID=1904965 RepID=UPI0021CCE6B4
MFHVGNARSLLLNWVVARQSGGTMVLRIEDTDAARSRPEWTEGILAAMAWLGVDAIQYEGPYSQTEGPCCFRTGFEPSASRGQTHLLMGRVHLRRSV